MCTTSLPNVAEITVFKVFDSCCPSHRLSECLDSEAETVMQLRSELREKEMKLTDIRLEALSSAHQLDQLREAMNRMQVCRRTKIHETASQRRGSQHSRPL